MLLSILLPTLLASSTLALPQPQSPSPSSSASATPTGDQYDSVRFQPPGDTIEECALLNVSWVDPQVPKGSEPRDLRYNVSMTVYAWTGGINTRNGGDLVPGEDLSVTTNYSTRATYPAGTTIEIVNSAIAQIPGGETAVKWNQRKRYEVVPGASQDCIPPSAYPMTIDTAAVANVSSCSDVTVSWNGSAPPYSFSVFTRNTIRQSQPETFRNLTDTSFQWKVAYPEGTIYSVSLMGANGSAVSPPTVWRMGAVQGQNCTIPAENAYQRPRSEISAGDRITMMSGLTMVGVALGLSLLI